MPEGIDTAAAAFQAAIDPGLTANETNPRAPAPRDTSGRFAAVAEKPEPFLEIRMVEGDPETGDTSDGGDDPRLRERERGIADGRIDERAERERAENAEDVRRAAVPAGDDERPAEGEQDESKSEAAGDEEGSDQDADEDAQYEITVDGEPQTVTLGELRDGYIRTATFHSRLNKVNEHKQAVEQENARVTQLRDLYINGLQHLDEDIRGITPQEPDWDAEFAKDPMAAHARQKRFQEIYAKLNQIRSQRAWAIQNAKEEQDRASAKYAVEQFSQFVDDHQKLIKDEPSLRRVIGGMRATALAEGFNETEVAGVYDKRMLNVLFKAWMYDQGMAVKPVAQAALPGPGRSLAPGSARPLNGSAGRRHVDEAQRQLARTGKLEDAQAYFQRLLT